MNIRTKLFLILFISFAVIFGIATVFYYISTEKSIISKWGEKFSAVAVHCASLIDGDEHTKILETKNKNSEAYKKIFWTLTNVKKLYEKEVKYIYTMVKAPYLLGGENR
jgi:hypothetical protein